MKIIGRISKFTCSCLAVGLIVGLVGCSEGTPPEVPPSPPLGVKLCLQVPERVRTGDTLELKVGAIIEENVFSVKDHDTSWPDYRTVVDTMETLFVYLRQVHCGPEASFGFHYLGDSSRVLTPIEKGDRIDLSVRAIAVAMP